MEHAVDRVGHQAAVARHRERSQMPLAGGHLPHRTLQRRFEEMRIAADSCAEPYRRAISRPHRLAWIVVPRRGQAARLALERAVGGDIDHHQVGLATARARLHERQPVALRRERGLGFRAWIGRELADRPAAGAHRVDVGERLAVVFVVFRFVGREQERLAVGRPEHAANRIGPGGQLLRRAARGGDDEELILAPHRRVAEQRQRAVALGARAGDDVAVEAFGVERTTDRGGRDPALPGVAIGFVARRLARLLEVRDPLAIRRPHRRTLDAFDVKRLAAWGHQAHEPGRVAVAAASRREGEQRAIGRPGRRGRLSRGIGEAEGRSVRRPALQTLDPHFAVAFIVLLDDGRDSEGDMVAGRRERHVAHLRHPIVVLRQQAPLLRACHCRNTQHHQQTNPESSTHDAPPLRRLRSDWRHARPTTRKALRTVERAVVREVPPLASRDALPGLSAWTRGEGPPGEASRAKPHVRNVGDGSIRV